MYVCVCIMFYDDSIHAYRGVDSLYLHLFETNPYDVLHVLLLAASTVVMRTGGRLRVGQ